MKGPARGREESESGGKCLTTTTCKRMQWTRPGLSHHHPLPAWQTNGISPTDFPQP